MMIVNKTVAFIIWFFINVAITIAYVVPKARIEVLHPKGFQVSVPDTPGIQMFAFHGNLNSPMEGLENGQFAADILKHKNGRWTFTNRKHEIKVGDVLYYWMYVQKDSLGYRRDDQKHEFTEADVFGSNNSTEDTTEPLETTEKPGLRPQLPPTLEVPTAFDNCNARTPSMKVFPQEVHHYHHHYLPGINSGCSGAPPPSPTPNFGSTPSSFGANSQYQPPTANSQEGIQQLILQMRQVMAAIENMKLKVATLSDVVDELINSNSNAKLLLTGASLDTTTNLFELVRHVILDKLELKDLKNDIYSATRVKNGIVFDVASGLDKRRILTRARERLRDEDGIRITDYYDGEPKADSAPESIIDVRFGD